MFVVPRLRLPHGARTASHLSTRFANAVAANLATMMRRLPRSSITDNCGSQLAGIGEIQRQSLLTLPERSKSLAFQVSYPTGYFGTTSLARSNAQMHVLWPADPNYVFEQTVGRRRGVF